MNNVSLIGNLTRDPVIRWSNDMAVARFSIAINRGKDKNGNDKGVDFPNIVVFGKQAENCEKYLSKGKKVGITGHIQTGSYEKDGQKIYTTDIVADRIEFLTPHNQEASTPQSYDSDVPQGFEAIDDEDIPF